MPHKGGKNKVKECKKIVRKDSNTEVPGIERQAHDHEDGGAVGGEPPNEDQPKNVVCCVPVNCEIHDLINVNEPGDAVRVVCNNDQCPLSGWMHSECFVIWQESVLSFLSSCGRARSWSEKQRLQNLWTKKGYDLAYKACDCKCARGHLRKDLDYFPKPTPSVAKKKHHKKGSDLPTLTVSSKGHHPPASSTSSNSNNKKDHKESVNATAAGSNISNVNSHSNSRERVGSFGSSSFRERVNSTSSNISSGSGSHRDLSSPRDRTSSVGSGSHMMAQISHSNMSIPGMSMSIPGMRNRHCSSQSMTSTGSSPPNSSNSMESPSSSSPGTPCTPVLGKMGSRKSKFDFFNEPVTSFNGVIFCKRDSLNAFSCLPRHKRNPYHIKMEDDIPHGYDDTRSFLMSNLSAYKTTSVHCLLCRNNMPVFDKYPLIDGTFFLSPASYDDVVSFPVESEEKKMYLHAVCIHCLEGAVRLLCQFCNRTWDGEVLGTMYSYDIFAAAACCERRFTCKTCSAPIVGPLQSVHFFSEYSQKVQCHRCHCEDHHFVKPLQELYYAQSICN